MPAAIIGGTGIYSLGDLDLQNKAINTKYGTVRLSIANDLVFLNRHAPQHSVPPHKINARAQIKALEILGVKRVFSLYAVGLINSEMKLGIPVRITDFIDLTRRDEHTIFDTLNSGIGHVDMSEPFCNRLGNAVDLDTQPGVYACAQGPRLETPAEIRALSIMGADIVGMTLSPEVPLMRECGMSVCALALPINWAAGVRPAMKIDHAAFKEAQATLLGATIRAAKATADRDCTAAKIF